jgi:hypothetical protein
MGYTIGTSELHFLTRNRLDLTALNCVYHVQWLSGDSTLDWSFQVIPRSQFALMVPPNDALQRSGSLTEYNLRNQKI